jgi:hypothetical protein
VEKKTAQRPKILEELKPHRNLQNFVGTEHFGLSIDYALAFWIN